MEQSARGGEGRGAGPNPCVGEGRCALVDWPDAGRNEPVMLVESLLTTPPFLDTRAGTRSCLFSGCVNLRVQVHIDS